MSFQTNNAAKLDVYAVGVIRATRNTAMAKRLLAKRYRVDYRTIGDIMRGKTWKGVPMAPQQPTEGDVLNKATIHLIRASAFTGINNSAADAEIGLAVEILGGGE